MNAVGSIGIWGLISQADFVSKIVISTLFIMSVSSWAIALYKFILLRVKDQQCKNLLSEIRSCKNLAEIVSVVKQNSKTLPAYILVQLLDQIKQAKANGDSPDSLIFYSDQILDNAIYHEQLYLPVLSVISEIATLFGLFGTVWGLVHAFIRISEKQSADIVTVAPGIAEALITTVAGLLVAIPALVFLHYLSTKVKDLEHQLVLISDKVLHIVRPSMLSLSMRENLESKIDNQIKNS